MLGFNVCDGAIHPMLNMSILAKEDMMEIAFTYLIQNGSNHLKREAGLLRTRGMHDRLFFRI